MHDISCKNNLFAKKIFLQQMVYSLRMHGAELTTSFIIGDHQKRAEIVEDIIFHDITTSYLQSIKSWKGCATPDIIDEVIIVTFDNGIYKTSSS